MTLLLALFALGCRNDPEDPAAQGVAVIVDPSGEHFLDAPFPSNDRLDDRGLPDLSGFPSAPSTLVAGVLDGWRDRVERTCVGFGNLTASYFRLEAPIDVPAETAGAPGDPLVWVDLDTGELLPVEVRFVEDPAGDPFYAPNTLVMAPRLGQPPRAGHTYAAVLLDSLGVVAPSGYTLPDGVTGALAAAGITDGPVVATVFTVQDATGQLRAIRDDVDARLPQVDAIAWKRVTHLTYTQGTTPSGRDATLAIATFEDGTSRTAYLSPGGAELVVDLEDWPMTVWEGDLGTLNYSGLDDRPYMSAGLGHLTDVERDSGWIDFDASGLLSVPDPEPMRVVLSLPRDRDAVGVVIHDHGTGGHAYNIVQRRSPDDRGRDWAQAMADAGWATLGHDAALYGTRYPLIDEGHSASLGFYNIVNTPAFRDNQRQTAIDAYVLRRYVAERLASDLPQGAVDTSRVRKTGHSLGSVTSHLTLAMAPELYESALVSGTGGNFLLYFFETGLVDAGGIDPALVESLFALVGATPPDTLDTQSVLGAALGLDEAAWGHLDRLHPAAMLFQWQMDPSDPMAVARDEALPITAVIAPGDLQTPDFTAEALVEGLPDAVAVGCEALGPYDPHYCIWREDEGIDALRAWLAE
jgi:hypothetical protein